MLKVNVGGRPRVLSALDEEHARKLYLSGHFSNDELIEKLGISRSSYFNYLKSWQLRCLRVGINDELGVHAQYYHKHGTQLKRRLAFDLVVIQLMAAQMRVKVQLVPCAFHQIFKRLEQGTIDLALANIAATPERASRLLLSRPYGFFDRPVENGIVEIACRPKVKTKTLSRLGVVKGTVHHERMLRAPTESIVRTYNSISQLMEALHRNVIDAAATHKLSVLNFLETDPLVFTGLSEATDLPTCAATSLSNSHLIFEINLVIERLTQNGILGELSHYFSVGNFLKGMPNVLDLRRNAT